MTFTATINQKGQIMLPKTFREVLGLWVGSKIEIEITDKRAKEIIIRPVQKPSGLAGSFKVKNPQDPVKLCEYVENNYERV